MSEVIVANCGLVCTSCGAYKRGRCTGCLGGKPMNSRCSMKACVVEHGYATCAECKDFEYLKDCNKLHNFISTIFSFIFRTNRIGNLNRIREIGLDKFKEEQA